MAEDQLLALPQPQLPAPAQVQSPAPAVSSAPAPAGNLASAPVSAASPAPAPSPAHPIAKTFMEEDSLPDVLQPQLPVPAAAAAAIPASAPAQATSETLMEGDPISALPQPQLPVPAALPASAPAQATSETLVEEDPISALPQPQLPAPAPAQANNPHLTPKNRLQEYAQRSSLPLPTYLTVCEGFPHAPKFSSSVVVGGVTYKSEDTFPHRKAAEQHVAKIALESISRKIKDEGCPIIREDTVFCKSILYEYAVKMNLPLPTYDTVKSEGLLPLFVSSTVFDGITYTGDAGRTKKEAEQMAARSVILSILRNSGCGTRLYEIIKSKDKLYAALHKVKDSQVNGSQSDHLEVNTSHSSGTIGNINLEAPSGGFTNALPTSATPEVCPSMNLPHHEFKNPRLEQSSGAIDLPIAFVHQSVGQSLGDGSNSVKKRRKNKKKANKKMRNELSIAPMPLSQAPACSVAQ